MRTCEKELKITCHTVGPQTQGFALSLGAYVLVGEADNNDF